MKNIVKKIYEGNSGFQRASEIRTQMFFAETAQALLFIAEMSGQISDGKYENSKPYNHWLWVAGKMEIFTKTSGDLGYISNYEHAKKYTITDHIKYITKGENWANRMLYFCKLGHVLDDLKVFKTNDKLDEPVMQALCDVFEYIGGDNVTSLDQLHNVIKEKCPEYVKKAIDKADKYLTDELLEAFSKYDYDVKNLKEDMAQMDETVNTYLGYKYK